MRQQIKPIVWPVVGLFLSGYFFGSGVELFRTDITVSWTATQWVVEIILLIALSGGSFIASVLLLIDVMRKAHAHEDEGMAKGWDK